MIRLFKDLVGFTLFAGIVWIVCAGIIGVFGPKWMHQNVSYVLFNANGQTFTRFQDVRNYKDVDVLVCGSSHAYRGFDPRVFKDRGYSLFNLGTSAQTPVQTKYVLERYLTKLNPKVVILETFPSNTFSNDGLSSQLDLLPKTPFDLNKVEMSLRINRVHSYNTLAANFFDSFIGYSDYENIQEDSLLKGSMYISGGFSEYQKSRVYDGEFNREAPWEINASAIQFEAFTSIIDFVNESDATLILVEAPVSEDQSQLVFLSEKAKGEIRNLPIEHRINYNDSLHVSYPDSVFYDPHHLRQEGVERFNKELIDDLEERGLLQAK
jgi:hypothetical protein